MYTERDFILNLTFEAPKKSTEVLYPVTLTQKTARSWLFLFKRSRQCRSKIWLQVLCSLILIYTDSKDKDAVEDNQLVIFYMKITHADALLGVEKTCAQHKFLAPLAIGQPAYVMVRCPSCVRPSGHASVRPCLNFFFKHLLL